MGRSWSKKESGISIRDLFTVFTQVSAFRLPPWKDHAFKSRFTFKQVFTSECVDETSSILSWTAKVKFLEFEAPRRGESFPPAVTRAMRVKKFLSLVKNDPRGS